ncbi:MAG: Calx-beta domain-containing protein [Actinomycetota bacterium]
MRKVVHGLLVLGIAGGALVFGAGQASAEACPTFTVSVSPPIVQEGGEASVTVSRRGVGFNSVDLNTVSVSATAGIDFESLDLTVHFGSETSRAFGVEIFDDDDKEGEERFKLHLSNPQGCEPGDNDLGGDKSVKIVASDQSSGGTPSPTSSPSPTPAPTATATASASPSPSPSPSVSPSPSPTPTLSPTPLATSIAASVDQDDDDGLGGLAIAGIVVAALALLAGTGLLLRIRQDRL